MRYRLRTLLLLLALAPPALALCWTTSVQAVANYRARHRPTTWEDVAGPGSIEPYTGVLCTLIVEAGEDDDGEHVGHQTPYMP